MITKRNGNGQTICKGCQDKGKFGLTWDSFLYNFNDEPYCFDCLMEKLEDLQQRIDKSIEYIKKEAVHYGYDDYEIFFTESEIEDLLEILEGDSNE